MKSAARFMPTAARILRVDGARHLRPPAVFIRRGPILARAEGRRVSRRGDKRLIGAPATTERRSLGDVEGEGAVSVSTREDNVTLPAPRGVEPGRTAGDR